MRRDTSTLLTALLCAAKETPAFAMLELETQRDRHQRPAFLPLPSPLALFREEKDGRRLKDESLLPGHPHSLLCAARLCGFLHRARPQRGPECCPSIAIWGKLSMVILFFFGSSRRGLSLCARQTVRRSRGGNVRWSLGGWMVDGGESQSARYVLFCVAFPRRWSFESRTKRKGFQWRSDREV